MDQHTLNSLFFADCAGMVCDRTETVIARAKRAFNEVYTALLAGLGEAMEGKA